jgi:DNA (cytosine-5)-methyltransferase 1
MNYGSVCSGIEAASVAWHSLGWKAAWLAEIERFPSEVLAHHYPDVPNLGDMTTISRRVLIGEVEAPDVLVGGTPCQAFSIAGLREGLLDERGQLTISYVRLFDAIDYIRGRAGKRASVAIWENVPGVLSSKDNAFGCFLGALAGEDCELQPPGKKWANAGCVFGPTRTVAWRILDAQYFGVAQRRRRVFVVASARKDFDPVKVLFEFDGVRRDSAPSRQQGQETAGTLASRTGAGGLPGTDEACSGYLQAAYGGNNTSGSIDVATARNACASASGRMDFESETFIVLPAVCVTGDITHTLKAEGFDASEDGTGRGQPIVAAFAENSRGELRLGGGDGSRCGTLSTGGGKPGQGTPTVLAGMAIRRLMPVECERLQGFPDGHTEITVRNKPAADGPRYKSLGNSMAVPVMAWIGSRIQLVEDTINA